MDSSSTGTGTNTTTATGTSHSPTNAPPWEHRIQALTHILTHPTLAPSLHSQLFIARRTPPFLLLPFSFSIPPFLCPSPTSLPLFSLSLFLSRASRFNLPRTSWRSLCPFRLPPPCILSTGVEPAPERWGPEERREYARKRFERGRFGVNVPQGLLFVVPNAALLSLALLFEPPWRKPG